VVTPSPGITVHNGPGGYRLALPWEAVYLVVGVNLSLASFRGATPPQNIARPPSISSILPPFFPRDHQSAFPTINVSQPPFPLSADELAFIFRARNRVLFLDRPTPPQVGVVSGSLFTAATMAEVVGFFFFPPR